MFVLFAIWEWLVWLWGFSWFIVAFAVYLGAIASRIPFTWPVLAPVIAVCVGMGMQALAYQKGYKAAETATELKWQAEVTKAREAITAAEEAKRQAELTKALELQKQAQRYLSLEARFSTAEQDRLDALRASAEAAGRDPVFNIPEPETLTCPEPEKGEPPRVLTCPKITCPVCRFGRNAIPNSVLRNFD